jgi:prophage tail gpP-like protein
MTAAKDDGELSIVVGGNAISGWEDIEVTLRAMAFPNSFTIRMSARDGIIAKAGDQCVVKIGGDTVITGYIDRDGNSANARGHFLTLVGRGKTQDLVDCSAEWESGVIPSADALQIATKLAQPYGITAKLGQGAAAGPKTPLFLLNYGETAGEIIQRVARNAGLLAYEDPQGNLLLAKTGTIKAASGIAIGVNVEDFDVSNGMDQRYGTVRCAIRATNTLGDIAGTTPDSFFVDTETDPNVPRHRLLYIVQEGVADDMPGFNKRRTIWEVTRRLGMATPIRATVDSWRDSGGALWAPNTLIDVDLPGLRVDKQMCIAEVTFKRSDDRGTTAEITALPPAAFALEPLSLQPTNIADVTSPDQGAQ